jgi:hypothetical protein
MMKNMIHALDYIHFRTDYAAQIYFMRAVNGCVKPGLQMHTFFTILHVFYVRYAGSLLSAPYIGAICWHCANPSACLVYVVRQVQWM